MAYEQREGQGSLFKNDDKKTDSHPDYRGDCTINGVKCWLSAWIKEGKNGKFMSLAIKPKEAGGKMQPGANKEETEIPF